MQLPLPPIRPDLHDGALVSSAEEHRRVIDAKGNEIKSPPVSARLTYNTIGHIRIPSGRVAVCDPMLLGDDVPYARLVPAGSHLVQTIEATFPPGDRRQTRIAFAVLRFSAAAPVTWTKACRVGTDPDELDDDEVDGFGVDGGMACFVDSGADIKAGAETNDWYDTACERMGMTDTIIIEQEPTLRADIFMCSAGTGDGYYFAFWGFDIAGNVACLVIDFTLLAVKWRIE